MKKSTIFIAILLVAVSSFAQTFNDLEEMQKFEGFFDFYYNPGKDQVCLVVEELDREFLYIGSLSSGVGHNDLGLDRGQIGGSAVVYFTRAGDRLLLVEPNLKFRADTDHKPEKKAVDEAFARSVLHGFEILDQQAGKYLIDMGDMLFSDAHGVAEVLAFNQQGSYSPDRDRSAVELSRTRAFPENVEFDVMLTFSGKPEGRLIWEVTPDPKHITVNLHHSFVELPDDNYTPREYHPGSGCIHIAYADYATPVYESVMKRFIIRHRLQKQDPGQAVSKPVEPIVYYLDNGTPEPVGSALLEGAGWWEEAFREIGFEDAFRVEMLPEGADPMDVRYNVIQWVHRSTRGWSYGNAVTDPRTGEIIKGHVSLGSLRVRQDFMIAQALVSSPYATDDGNHRAMMELALARIRQLSVHEIGHTLGFVHNYTASTNGRSSVMDYPHPLVYIKDGEIKLDRSYARGIGEWDKVTVAYAYSEIEGDETHELQAILKDAADRGLRYISDRDARAEGGAHPHAHLWDNGASAIDELQQILDVRALAISNFSLDNIPAGEPVSTLEDVFVPLYFFHRYQVEAATKLVGGVDYTYAVKGDGSVPHKALDGETQRKALEKVLLTLEPSVLMIPEDKLELFPPRAPGFGRTRESFNHRTGITFDYLAPPSASANLTLRFLLHPERANRLVLQKALDRQLPGLDEVIRQLLDKTLFADAEKDDYKNEVRQTVNFITIDHLISLANDPAAMPQVRAIMKDQLNGLKSWLEEHRGTGLDEVYRTACIDQIMGNQVIHLEHLPEIPPGSPIGMECLDY